MGGSTVLRRRAPAGPPRPVVLDVLGRRVAVDAGGHTAAAQVEALWSRCRPAGVIADQATDPGGADLDADLVITLPRSDRPLSAEVGLRLTDQVVAAAVAGGEGRLTLLRAGAVAAPDGSVLGLLAGPGGGRSAAAAELCRRGFGYVTDEVLAVTGVGDVLAFPKPLAFEQGTDEPAQAGPDALGMRACPASLRLAGLVVLERDPVHAGAPQLSKLEAGAGHSHVERALLAAPGATDAGHLADALIAAVDGVWLLRYDEVFPAAPLLADLLLERTRPAHDTEPRYVATGIGTAPVDGSTVTVRGHQVELDALRAGVWQAAAGGASLEELTVAMNIELGRRHRLSPQLVAAAVRDLLALGLLVAAPLPGLSGQRRRAVGKRP